jgi:hypothetical protein
MHPATVYISPVWKFRPMRKPRRAGIGPPSWAVDLVICSEEVMRTGRAIVLSAVIALSAAGAIFASTAPAVSSASGHAAHAAHAELAVSYSPLMTYYNG